LALPTSLTLKRSQPLPATGAGCDPYSQTAEAKPQRRRSKLDQMRTLSKKIGKRGDNR
jgi:hypothetical protein